MFFYVLGRLGVFQTWQTQALFEHLSSTNFDPAPPTLTRLVLTQLSKARRARAACALPPGAAPVIRLLLSCQPGAHSLLNSAHTTPCSALFSPHCTHASARAPFLSLSLSPPALRLPILSTFYPSFPRPPPPFSLTERAVWQTDAAPGPRWGVAPTIIINHHQLLFFSGARAHAAPCCTLWPRASRRRRRRRRPAKACVNVCAFARTALSFLGWRVFLLDTHTHVARGRRAHAPIILFSSARQHSHNPKSCGILSLPLGSTPHHCTRDIYIQAPQHPHTTLCTLSSTPSPPVFLSVVLLCVRGGVLPPPRLSLCVCVQVARTRPPLHCSLSKRQHFSATSPFFNPRKTWHHTR